MLIDSHAHLDFPEFANDLETVLERARSSGVERIITIGTTIESSRQAVALAERFPMVFATVGLHPNQITAADDNLVDQLRPLAAHPKVVAIGETGLDYHYLPSRNQPDSLVETAFGAETGESLEQELHDDAVKAAQALAFQQQLELAVELGKNVVVHQRESWEDTVALLQPFSDRVKAVLHCFNLGSTEALEVIGLGHFISFTGLVTFKNAATVREAAKRIPADRYMVETDCPYLAPVPHRGKRSEPAHVTLIAEAIAEARGESVDKVASDTSGTVSRFFGV
jgi:TatD DNase family protein